MPNYSFYCEDCDARADEFLTFAQHGDRKSYPRCLSCNKTMSILIDVAPNVSGNGFTPCWNTGLGQVVHSAREQDQVAKSLGLEMKE